jgi:hypothetical protein
MANTAHLFRRQSSRDLNGSHRDYTKTLDELELKVQKQLFTTSISSLIDNLKSHFQRLKEKLVRAESLDRRGPLYGATNQVRLNRINGISFEINDSHF